MSEPTRTFYLDPQPSRLQRHPLGHEWELEVYDAQGREAGLFTWSGLEMPLAARKRLVERVAAVQQLPDEVAAGGLVVYRRGSWWVEFRPALAGAA